MYLQVSATSPQVTLPLTKLQVRLRSPSISVGLSQASVKVCPTSVSGHTPSALHLYTFTEKVSVTCVTLSGLDAEMVTEDSCVMVVGVPVIAPLVLEKVRPTGSVPESVQVVM